MCVSVYKCVCVCIHMYLRKGSHRYERRSKCRHLEGLDGGKGKEKMMYYFKKLILKNVQNQNLPALKRKGKYELAINGTEILQA